MSFKILIQLLVLVVVVAGIFLYFHNRNLDKLNHFKTNGVQTTATVINTKSEYKSRRRLSGRRRYLSNYEIEVRYFTKNHNADTTSKKKTIERDEDGNLRMNIDKPSEMGELVLTSIKVKMDYFKNINKGDKINILYLPDDVEKAILREDLE